MFWLYLTKHNLLIKQLHYQILLIISQKEFTKKVSRAIQWKINAHLSIINYSDKIDEKLKKRFKNTFKFSNNDINKFILLPRKGVYSYEYMNDLEKFNEASLLVKEIFYSNLNMEDIRGHPQKKSDKNINQDMLLLEVEIWH